MERRRAKGLPESKYRRCETPEELVWTVATINRIARNPIYIGSRFTSAMYKYGRSYKCTGKMPTNRRPRICFLGADVLMNKLDGLVIQMCIRKFTGYDLRRKAMGKVVELEGEIESKRALQQSYRDIAQELHENYSAVIKRIIRFAKDDAEAENWIAAERSEYERKCKENRKGDTPAGSSTTMTTSSRTTARLTTSPRR